MTTLNEQLATRRGPLTEALRSLGHCRTVEELRQAIRTQEPLVAEAERFAKTISHVETGEAAAFRDAVRTVRKTLNGCKESLGGVVAPVKVEFVRDPASNPQPPADALILTRAEARDTRNYERAKAKAEREGRPLWIEPA
jgi:hypothetical protein